jgi:hypothetical protein
MEYMYVDNRTDVKRRSLFLRSGGVSASSLPQSSGVGRPRWAGYQISLRACVCVYQNHQCTRTYSALRKFMLTDEFSIVDGSLSLGRVSLPRRYNLLRISALCHINTSRQFCFSANPFYPPRSMTNYSEGGCAMPRVLHALIRGGAGINEIGVVDLPRRMRRYTICIPTPPLSSIHQYSCLFFVDRSPYLR